MAEQVPPELIEKIELAYDAIQNIRKIVVQAKNKIEKEASWIKCINIAENASEDINAIVNTPVLEDPYDTLKNMAPAMQRQLPKDLPTKLNRGTLLFGGIIGRILENVLKTENKAEMNEAFTELITEVMNMESKWQAIHDYAKPVPQEAPRKERRTRGGRKHRTHRKRTQRKRTHRRCTHRK